MSDLKSHEPHRMFHEKKMPGENLYRKQKNKMTKESGAKTRAWDNRAPKRSKSK